jgi:UDP-GlcNAc:undecaprenyl-phosphate GlcNAc-1-phosphate transferase
MPTQGLLLVALSAAFSFLVCRNAAAIGTRFGLLDFPDPDGGRKQHAAVTPLVGGLAVVGATLLAAAGLALMPDPGIDRSMLLWFIATVVGMFIIGASDDRFGLTAPTRLAAASAILLTAIAKVPDFSVSFLLFAGQGELVLLPGYAGIAFTLLCFVGFLNAVNMADGKNGLVLGQAMIWAAILYLRLPAAMSPLILAIGAALAITFVFNMRGKLFLGDGGSYGLSAMFGLLAIYAWNHGFADMRADDIALIFAVPVFDTLRLILQRSLQKKSPFTPGRDHLHHYLYTRWGWPKPLPWVLALVAIPNFAAVMTPGTGLIWLGLTLLGYGALLWAATIEPRRRTA